jgi:hypothetical protein
MSSDDQSDIDQSPTLPLPSSVPNQEEHIERIVNNRGLRTFLIVDHTANLRKNSKISAIWHHGGERRRLDDNKRLRRMTSIGTQSIGGLMKAERVITTRSISTL